MKCLACGSENYTQYHRMESLKFQEDSAIINYSPIKTPE